MALSATNSVCRSDGGALRVYTDIPQVEEFLTRPEFVISMCCHSVLNYYISFQIVIILMMFSSLILALITC